MSVKQHHYVMSDPHLGHKNILKFGFRKFPTVDEHDEFIINEIYKLQAHDVLWILGDVAMDKKKLERLAGAPCTLGLIGGNHDTFALGDYLKVFSHICGARACNTDAGMVILTHIPIHPDEFYRWKHNIHGHTHGKVLNDPRYISVCCEQTECKPVKISELVNGRNHEPL